MGKQNLTQIEKDLIEGLSSAVKHSKGEMKLTESVREIPEPPPQYSRMKIKKLREHMGYSQPAFAAVLNVAPGTLRSWEQGARNPSEAANRLLQIFDLVGPEVIQKIKRNTA